MGPVQAIKTCLAKSFQFSGRASRAEFWWYAFFVGIGWNLLALSEHGLTGLTDDDLVPNMGIAYFCLNAFAFFAAAARRIQDVGVDGKRLQSARHLIPVALVLVVAAYVVAYLSNLRIAGFLAFGAAAAILYPWGSLVFYGFLGYLTRPSQPGPNRYGPNPLEVTP